MIRPDSTPLRDPYDTHQAMATVQAFQEWSLRNAERPLDPATSALITDFREWLEAMPTVANPTIPFGMHFQEWPMTLPSTRGRYDPVQQVWVPLDIDGKPTREALYATQVIGGVGTIDNTASTVRTVTFCLIIVPDDLPCNSDIKFD